MYLTMESYFYSSILANFLNKFWNRPGLWTSCLTKRSCLRLKKISWHCTFKWYPRPHNSFIDPDEKFVQYKYINPKMDQRYFRWPKDEEKNRIRIEPLKWATWSYIYIQALLCRGVPTAYRCEWGLRRDGMLVDEARALLLLLRAPLPNHTVGRQEEV